jgi:hypothetical protein
VRNRVRRNQVSSTNSSQNLSSYGFIVTIVGEIVPRVSFASRGSVRREQKWSGLTRTSSVPKPRMQMPRAKTIVRTVPAWGDKGGGWCC